MQPIPLYILAGGKSSRFGSDKARVEIAGRPLILRLVDALAPITQAVYVIAPTDQYNDLGLTSIPDVQPGLGPLGGLVTALEHLDTSGGGWLMLCSCDITEVSPAWFEHLWSHQRPGARALVMRDDHWQSLAALYHSDALPIVRRQIAAGERAMHRLLEVMGEAAVAVDATAELRLRQVNRPRDLPS